MVTIHEKTDKGHYWEMTNVYQSSWKISVITRVLSLKHVIVAGIKNIKKLKGEIISN